MSTSGESRALDRAIDQLLSGREEVPAEIAGLVGVASAVREAVLEGHPIVLAGDAPRSRLRGLAIGAVAAVLSLTVLGGAAFAASAHALPGQKLYDLKRAFERAALAMRTTENGRASFAWTLAQRRLAELNEVAGSPAEEQARAAYEDALARAEGSFLGSDEVLLDTIQVDLARHEAVLNNLLSKVPALARPGIERAITHASEAKERARSSQAQNVHGRGGKSRPPR